MAVEPPVSGPGRPRYPYSLESLTSRRAAVEADGVEAVRRSNPTYSDSEAFLRAKYGRLHSVTAMVESWFGFHLEDIHAVVRDLTVPALLVYGEHGVIADADAHELAERSASMTFRRVDDAGHNIPWENWPGFHTALEGYLGERQGAEHPR